MTLLHFTFGAKQYHDQNKGSHIIHCWISQSEMTQTDAPGAERKAAKDASHVMEDILVRNINTDDERLLQDGEMPADVIPVFTYALGVSWDRENKIPSYKQFDYETLCPERRFAPVLALGRELYDYTFSVLKKRERFDRKELGLKNKFVWDNITIAYGREAFKKFCTRTKARFVEWGVNKARFECPNLRNGFCSPSKPGCPCYKNGRCEEVKFN